MIHFSNISKHYGSKVLYKNASFQLNAGDKVGLVGPNGAGKTTLFRMVVNEESPDTGQVTKSDKLVVSYFSQHIEDLKGRSVLEEVRSGAGPLPAIQARLLELEHKLTESLDDDEMAKVLELYGELQSDFERLGGYDLDSRAAEILTGLGIPVAKHSLPVETFSGGWKMRIALAKILLLNPDVLLMDEPTNHLDLESILWLEQWLRAFKGSILMTSHDREFMNRIVSRIAEVAYQTITTYSGNYDFYEKDKSVRLEQLRSAARRQEDMLAKEEEFIARFGARASHAAQVQSRVKKIEKIDRIEIPTEEKAIQFVWPEAARSGEEVVKIEGLGKYWTQDSAGPTWVFRGADALVKRRDRIAVIGVNGAGKSTLLKIIAGQTQPSEGKCTLGASLEVGYFSQSAMDVLNPNVTVVEEIHSRIPTANLGVVRNLLGSLKFSGDEVEKKISVLSGGEKSRVVLATILCRPINFLVLDEPTNHIDIQSREILLQALLNFQGTVIVVSHDRHFLRALTNKVFHLDHQELIVFQGKWDEYVERFGDERDLFHSVPRPAH